MLRHGHHLQSLGSIRSIFRAGGLTVIAQFMTLPFLGSLLLGSHLLGDFHRDGLLWTALNVH